MVASPNFAFLAKHDELLVRYGAQAERYVFEDPNSALIKLRQLAELLALKAATAIGIEASSEVSFLDVLNQLYERGVLTPEASQLFHGLRKSGNAAAHDNAGTQREALYQLRMARTLAIWFHKSFGKDTAFKPGPFVPPPDPRQAESALADELNELRQQLAKEQEKAAKVKLTAAQEAKLRADAEAKAKAAYADLTAALELAEESEKALANERKKFEQRLSAEQADVQKVSPADIKKIINRAKKAAAGVELSEEDTRKLIDRQLCDAGWEADSNVIRFSAGSRPEKGRNQAIAEWPTASGPADYALFVGLTPIAVVEAKRKTKDVAGSIEQAKRYSRGFKPAPGQQSPGGPWDQFKVPFLFATNGRPFLRQLRTKSGIWFLDARVPTNHPRPLEGWYTPDGLSDLLAADEAAAAANLQSEPTDYLPLRDFQKEAIAAVEAELAKGRRELLLAMATGTGKTRTCIGLIYRLIKAKRFKRVLFLVDRTALGEQATNALKDVRLENLQSFTDIYDVKEMGDLHPDADTKLHIGTIQGMMRRLLYPTNDELPAVDLYDCIVIDECHRGYNLDRELSETELTFRNEAEYISKYRRVLDHFDAVKIGLTATPALHTTEIFGQPVYTYSYRQAVIDGWLIDHEPPVNIITKLAKDGITWLAKSEMMVLKKRTQQLDLIKLDDDVNIKVDEFNRRVITENFNKVVCAELARQIDPNLPGKTMIFCATDPHADMVVDLLKKAFAAQYGSVEDDAVIKITAAADNPLKLLRRYKNERLPKVAVTVDLLTTGIDVPEITNLVFIRRVRSRILYEQMLGRATRLCPDLFEPGKDKEVFRIFDCVDLYSALEPYTSMKPVVQNPKITFTQLAQEMVTVKSPKARLEVQSQILAKLQRKKSSFSDDALEQFKLLAGDLTPTQLIGAIKHQTPAKTAQWFSEHPGVAEFLDEVSGDGDGGTVILSTHADELVDVAHGYGNAKKPEDYLESFRTFVKTNINDIPALLVVTQRPRDLTRQQLKELKLALDQAGFTESTLRTAWKDMTNQDIAASIIGFVRQSALGSPLIPYQDRVARAMKAILASQPWTQPQRQWLQRIAKQLNVETIVDREAIDHGQFKAEGGYPRLNKVFDGKLDGLLKDINEELWRDSQTG